MNRLGLGAWVALLAAGAPAMAHAAASTDDVVAPQGTAVSEVVVTALKRSERLQEVPASLTAFTPEAIQQAHIEGVRDVARLVPNFSISEGEEPGQVFISIRGVGQIHNGDPPVAVVVDGVQLYDIDQITQNLFDIQQIEVLKGPQGDVYGRDAIGGAINIVTRQPTDTFTGSATAKVGDYGLSEFQASVSGPIVPDKLLFRIAGDVRSFGGDIEDVTEKAKANGEQSNDVRVSLIAKPTEKLKIEVTASRDSANSGAAYYSFVPPGASPNDIEPVQGNLLGRSNRLLEDISVKVDYDLGFATLTSITGYDWTKTALFEDFDYLPPDYLSATQNLSVGRTSEEVRLTSADHGPFKWFIGGAYLNTRQTLQSDIFLDPGASGVLVPFAVTQPTLFAATGATDHNNDYSAFGRASYRLSKWEFAVGLRYDLDQRQETQLSPGDPSFQKNFHAFQPKFTLSYFVNDQAMVYATAGEGFRSGGFNPNAQLGRLYQPEEDWNYELGAKTSWLDGRLTLNGAAFYTTVHDRQIYILDLQTASQIIVNPVKDAYIEGVESDLWAKLATGLDLMVSGGYLHTRVTAYDTSALAGTGVDGDYTGNALPETPARSYAVALRYHHPVGPFASLRAEFTGNGGDYYWTIDNVEKRKDVNLTNLRAELSHGNYTLSVFVQNLFNEIYIVDYEAQRWSGSPLGDYNLRSTGRLIEVSLSAKF